MAHLDGQRLHKAKVYQKDSAGVATMAQAEVCGLDITMDKTLEVQLLHSSQHATGKLDHYVGCKVSRLTSGAHYECRAASGLPFI